MADNQIPNAPAPLVPDDSDADPQEAAAASGWRRMLSDTSDPNDTQGIQSANSPIDYLAGTAGAKLGANLVRGAAEAAPSMLNIEHYSPEPNLTTLDPAKMGSGVDAYTPGRSTNPPFSFSYREGTQPEGLVKDRAPYKYTGQVDSSKLYDLSTDPEGIASKAIQDNGGVKDMSQIAQATKDAGYSGFITSQHPDPASQNSIMMFDQVPLKPAGAKGNDLIRAAAQDYNQSVGLPPVQSPDKMIPVDPERGASIAQAYDAMPHTPNDPETKQAYNALINETKNQFQGLQDLGLKIDKIQPGQPNPYQSSKDLFNDINNNKHIWYYPTEQGFGSSGKDFPNNPMLKPSGIQINGEPTANNDIFRIVHDIYGHAKEGNSFGPTGEENAWLQHKQMYSPEAQKAMTTETRGQNSWVNFGPNGAANRANPAATTYADQKVGLLPTWANSEGFKTKKAYGGKVMTGGSGDPAEAGSNLGYAKGGSVMQGKDGAAVGASLDPIQGGNLNAYAFGGVTMNEGAGSVFADGGQVADTSQSPQQSPTPAPQQQPTNTTNVMSPTGDLVSIPNEQVAAALHPVNGYRLATPDDIAAYQQTQKYGTPGQIAQTFGESALSTSTMGLVPGIGSPEDIRARQQENPIANIAGGVLPFAAEQFVPGAGEAADVGMLGKIGQAATTVPRMIGEAGDAITSASGLTGVGAKALQYAAESAIMQGQEEVSKMLLKDPNQSVTSAIADEGLASLFGGALGASIGGIGKVADLWESKFGAKAGDAAMNPALPDIPTLELQSGVDIPASLHGALSGNPDDYSTVQTLMKSDTVGGDNVRSDVHQVYADTGEETLKALQAAADWVTKSPNAYEIGSSLRNKLVSKLEAAQQIYGPIYDALRPRYAAIAVTPDQKTDFVGDLTNKLSSAGIGTLQGSAEASTMNNLFSSLDTVTNAEGVKNLLSGLNNSARNPELSRLAAVAGPAIKDFESKVVTDYLTKISDGSAPQELARLSDKVHAAVDAGSPSDAIEAAANVETAQGNYGARTAMDAQKAASLLGQRKIADAAYKDAMSDMTDLKNAIGLGRFKGTNGFLRALDEKSPEQILSRLGTKNRQDLTELLQNKFPEAAKVLKDWHLNEDLHDAALPNGTLNTKKFLNNFLDGSTNPLHIQAMMADSPAAIPRLQAIQKILNALPKDGNPSNSAAMFAKLMNGKVGGLMGATMGLGGGHIMGAVLGDLGENVLKEVRPFISYKMLQMRGSGTGTSPSSVKALVDYAKSVSKGHSLVNKSVNSLFNANRILPDSKIPSESDRNKLDRYVTQVRNNPSVLSNTAANLKDVMPDHLAALSLQASQAAKYLASIKPHPVLGLPFDSKIPPTVAQITEYHRQLDIAQQPLMALKYMKDGSLTPNDLSTIKNVHPDMYQQLSAKIMGELPNAKQPIPYKTRMSMSLFVGQPLDSTLTPQAIISAQPLPPAQVPQGGAPGNKPKRSTSSLNKLPGQYKTPTQAADSDRATRD